jgi:membrane-associated protease RseP (regulator of RpoE activity)
MDAPFLRQIIRGQIFSAGLNFPFPFLLILTVHEFGHYFVARYHKVKVTLPYYLPMPPFQFSLGTMGALIRLREKVYSKKQNFDIGLAGPLAGFV